MIIGSYSIEVENNGSSVPDPIAMGLAVTWITGEKLSNRKHHSTVSSIPTTTRLCADIMSYLLLNDEDHVVRRWIRYDMYYDTVFLRFYILNCNSPPRLIS